MKAKDNILPKLMGAGGIHRRLVLDVDIAKSLAHFCVCQNSASYAAVLTPSLSDP